jgi:hypothetical protein
MGVSRTAAFADNLPFHAPALIPASKTRRVKFALILHEMCVSLGPPVRYDGPSPTHRSSSTTYRGSLARTPSAPLAHASLGCLCCSLVIASIWQRNSWGCRDRSGESSPRAVLIEYSPRSRSRSRHNVGIPTERITAGAIFLERGGTFSRTVFADRNARSLH